MQGTFPLYIPGTSEPVCLVLILWPVAPPPFLCTLCTCILGEVVVSRIHCHMWLVAQVVLGPLYGFFFLWQAFLLCPGAGIPVHECASLFSLLPLWGQSYSMSITATIFCNCFCKTTDLKLV
jgi:hypothetical protein